MKEKKHKVLHTRVSESLDRDLKERASRLGLSVSTLVRNVLMNTFELVETVVADSARIADSARDIANPTVNPTPDSNQVLGWQKVLLNINAICCQCNEILPRGSEGALAVQHSSPSPQAICFSCLATLMEDR
jgi:hypothetical protein